MVLSLPELRMLMQNDSAIVCANLEERRKAIRYLIDAGFEPGKSARSHLSQYDTDFRFPHVVVRSDNIIDCIRPIALNGYCTIRFSNITIDSSDSTESVDEFNNAFYALLKNN